MAHDQVATLRKQGRWIGGCTQFRRIQEALGDDLSGGFLVFTTPLIGTTHTMPRIFVGSVALVAITIVLLLHATHHGAQASSGAHCGFWTEIEEGLSCR
jgi:hypothetical protein